jgi:hypothetical protein
MRPQPAVGADPVTGRSRFTAGLVVATVTPLVLAPLLAPSRGRGTSEIIGILVVVAYAGHVAVTGWLWSVPDVRLTVRTQPMRLIGVPVSLVLVAAILAMVLPGHLLGCLLLGFFAWQFSHFQRQNLGLVKLIATKWAAEPLTNPESRLVAVAGWCAMGGLIARPSLLGLPTVVVPRLVAGPMFHLAMVAYTTCTIAAVIVAIRRRRAVPVAAAYLTSVLFVAPVFLFQSAQAAVAGMVVAHGLQYLWVVRCRSRQARMTESRTGWQNTLAVIAVAVLGGSMLTAISEVHLAQGSVLNVLYGAYLGIVMAHFVVDGALWRRTIRPEGASPPRWALPLPAHGRF